MKYLKELRVFKKQPLLRFDSRKLFKFLLINIVIFYGLKWYYDTRQINLVTNLSRSVVKVSPIGHQIVTLSLGEIELRIRVGFGPMGHGSGVFIDKNGTILTCAHVVADTSLAEITLNGDKKVKAYVLGRDVENDVALLRPVVPLKGIVPVKVAKEARKGLNVLTIGFPGPYEKYVTAGIVSGFMEDSTMTDMVIAPGNSGGGVFNCNGQLIGLARAISGYLPIPVYQGFNVVTSLEFTKKLIEKYAGF